MNMFNTIFKVFWVLGSIRVQYGIRNTWGTDGVQFQVVHMFRSWILNKFFVLFRAKHRTILFCYYCGFKFRIDKLKDHCENVHNDVVRALGDDEEPKLPLYTNWKEYTQKYPEVERELSPNAKIWKNPNGIK